MRILFLCLSTIKFDAETPYEKPLGGTESAVAHLSTALANLGHSVQIASCNDREVPRHYRLTGIMSSEPPIPWEAFDVIIIPNAPYIFPNIRDLAPQARLVFWNHMQPDQPAMAHFNQENREFIDLVVYVSSRQRGDYLNLQPGTANSDVNPVHWQYGEVINNAISPSFENLFKNAGDLLADKECRGAYTSTPFRGLEHLRDIREIPIDIYSSMAVYQQSDMPYMKIFGQLSHNSALSMHGSLSQVDLARALKRAAFLVYPCTFRECHSIAILEAAAAGCYVVSTKAAGEDRDYMTVSSGVHDFKPALLKAIKEFKEDPRKWAEQRLETARRLSRECTWAKRAETWELMLHKLTLKEAA